jgi:hypothetical protein
MPSTAGPRITRQARPDAMARYPAKTSGPPLPAWENRVQLATYPEAVLLARLLRPGTSELTPDCTTTPDAA